ncbi:SH3 domain protein [Desulfonatronum thiosulfatophilum]|uniref:SH3 domain protein n=1 Tax=Desulfonatronum thiosulfatophilum TaxID=617002 RepID=A0A1G6A047_9BACT|nr:TIGR04211 family SH3 domain-containing protein [Desulfonatronum thiosulfatophilum]SDB01782.1 SH3 domain protein [Desulfonatronum thiosulfatophilum]
MLKSHPFALIIIWLVMTVCAATARAETIYVSDVREISMRIGPSTENRILRMLPAGSKMELLEERDGWLRVRATDNVEGWVLKRFTSGDTPVSLKYQTLREEYASLHSASSGALGRIAELEEINKNLMEVLSTTSNNLLSLDREHAALRLDAANVLDLREQFDRMAVKLAAVQTEAEALRQDNSRMKNLDRFYWFLCGGAVFLVAWLAGVITGRMQGKRRNTLQYT